MKRLNVLLVIVATVIFLLPAGQSQASPLISITTSPATVEKYEKFEVSFTLSGVDYNAINPFNPNLTGSGSTEPYQKPGIKVDGYFRKVGESPWILQPAFYDGNGNWRLRFAAKTTGNWEYKIRAEDISDANESTSRTFTVTDTQNPGFLQVNPNDSRFFQFEDGTPFTPVGTAISGIGTDSSSLGAIDKMGQNGMNFSRVFLNSSQIEVMGTDSNPAQCSNLNNYNLSKAANVDAILDHARAAGVYIEWVQEDWEKLYDRTAPTPTKNTYVACGSAVASNVSEMFSNASAKEIYKRKLRYIAARWGYSTNLMAIELVNELGGASGDTNWHIETGNYYHNVTPYSKHMFSSSNGSEEMRTAGGIPWDNAALDFVNYHSYGRCGTTWSNSKFSTQLETLNSPEGRPWQDSATWADRIIRAYRGNNWNKPFLWTEFGLIKIVGSSWEDWNTMYTSDTAGRHLRDALWASTLNGYAINHWKNDYVNGVSTYAPDKYAAFRSLANYTEGINFTGLKQETTYPVADPRNPAPTTTSSNPNIFAISMKDNNKAYFYVKNATVPWIGVNTAELNSACAGNTYPTPSAQAGTIQVKGLSQGSYVLEKWSTVDTNKSTQILEKNALAVGADGIVSISIGLGTTHNTSNFTDSYDFAYKIYQGGVITLTSTADKSTANVGEIVTITNQIVNNKITTENNLNFTNYLPYRTSLQGYDAGGITGTKSVSCAEASNYNYPSCSGSFAIPTVAWSGISLSPGQTKNFNLAVKVQSLSSPDPNFDLGKDVLNAQLAYKLGDCSAAGATVVAQPKGARMRPQTGEGLSDVCPAFEPTYTYPDLPAGWVYTDDRKNLDGDVDVSYSGESGSATGNCSLNTYPSCTFSR